MKITDALLAEHVVFHNLFDYLERTAPKLKTAAEIRSLARLLECLLQAHSRTEEELIIAPLDHCFDQIGQRETFHQEHDEIDANLKLAQIARTAKKARGHLMSAVMSSRKHFDKEERIVFPLAEQLLTAKTLAGLWQTWMEQRNRAIA